MAVEIGHPWLDRRRTAFVLLAIMAVAAAVRMLDLSRSGIWPDEAFTWYLINRPFLDMYRVTIQDSHPPLFNVLLWLWVQVFGDSETALRMPSALFGTATVFILYLVGTRFWDRATGLLSASLLTFSGFHIWYSQEARSYALLGLTSTLYMYSIARIREEDGWSAYILSCVCAVLMLFSHVFGTFLFAGINLFIGIAWLSNAKWLRVNFFRWFCSQLLAVLIFGYWAIKLMAMSARASWIPELDLYQFLLQLAQLFNGPFAAVILCGLALFFIHQQFYLPEKGHVGPHRGDADIWGSGLALVWLSAPVLLAIGVSLAAKPVFVSRYMILCLPAMCLVAARGLLMLKQHRKFQIWTAVLLVAGLSVSTWYAHHLERDQFRMVVSEVRSRHQPGDLLVVVGKFAVPTVNYYWRNPDIEVAGIQRLSELDDLITGQNRVWVIDWNPWKGDADLNYGENVGSHTVAFSQRGRKVDLYLLRLP